MESEPLVNIRGTEQGMKKVNEEIEEVKGEIDKVEKKIDILEKKIDETSDQEEKRLLRKKEEQLRKEKEQLRKEKEQLRKKEEQVQEKELILLRQTAGEPGPSGLQVPPAKRPNVEGSYGMLSANEAKMLKDEKNFTYKCDRVGGETSTFYFIDVDHPKRYQTSILLTKKIYRSYDLCECLTPIGSTVGAYSEVCTCPRVFFWLFSKNEMKRASNTSMEDLSSRMKEVAFDDILKPLLPITPDMFVIFDLDLVISGKGVKIDVEIDELTRNRSIVHQLKTHSMLQKFTIESQTSSLRNITVHSTSKEDIVMYNTEKFVEKGVATGAAVRVDHMSEMLEDEEESGMLEDEEEEGMAAEVKLEPQERHKKQLIANMTKVAGDLALMAVKNKQTLFDKIKVYGLLVNCKSGYTQVLSLLMDFKRGVSTLESCNDPQDFNDCICRLSVALDHHT